MHYTFVVFFENGNSVKIVADYVEDGAAALVFRYHGETVASFNQTKICGCTREDNIYGTH